MKKLTLLATAMATLFGGVAMAQRTVAKPKVVAPARVAGYTTNCTTHGDALGGLQIIAAGNKLTIRESTMEGKTVTWTTQITANELNAMRLGYAMTVPVFSPKANMFGGAVSPAHLLTLSAKPKGGQRSGFLARQNVVYYLVCQGPY